MRYYYAIVNTDDHGNQICTGTIDTFKPIVLDNYIETEEVADSMLGKMWTGTEWVDNPNPPIINIVD